MPRAKAFDKKTATTFSVVHRPQNDPLIHDSDAPSLVFAELPSSSKHPNKSKIKSRRDLEEEFGLSGSIRQNEGEAAEHGIYFDDTNYDYMQHMRDLGGSGEATWVEGPAGNKSADKGKAKQSLEDALRETSLDGLEDDSQSIGGMSFASSVKSAGGVARKATYQDQQDIPDALAGFQPDMDPRLREVLEALDDEEYVDDEDNIFAELAGNGADEIDQYEWEATPYEDDDDDGWESDDTTKPTKEYRVEPLENTATSDSSQEPSTDSLVSGIPDARDDGDWLASFAKFKGIGQVPTASQPPSKQEVPDVASSAALSSTSQFSRRKKRKGALSSSTGLSMTSSALARTEPLSTLDARFDKIAESYLEDEEDFDDNASFATGMTGMSKASNMSKISAFGGSQASEAPSLAPARFNSILDEFLGGQSGKGRGRAMRKAGRQGQWGQQSGMDQLDEIRQGLGPARLSSGKKVEI